jgi:hypothetical protein
MTAGAYDPVEDMLKVKSVQRKWRDSFTGSDLNPGKWTSEIGPGASLSVGGGVLTMASGTAAGTEASIRNYVTSIDVRNAHATVATEVVIKDGATVIWRQLLPAAMAAPVEIVFPTPLRGTAATAMNLACLTTGAQVYVNAQGYAAP